MPETPANPKAEVKTWFSILRNLYIYYRLRDLKALATDLVAHRRELPPSSTLVYVLGLALREKPKEFDVMYTYYLCKLPPWLLYGALWYANIPKAEKLLRDHAKPDYVPEPYFKVAKPYAEQGRPQKVDASHHNPLLFPKATTPAQTQQQRLEELWAQWYATGDAARVPSLIELIGDHETLADIAKAAHQYHAQEGDQDATAANLVMDTVCQTKTEKMLMGSLIYDKRLYDLVNKFARPKQPSA